MISTETKHVIVFKTFPTNHYREKVKGTWKAIAVHDHLSKDYTPYYLGPLHVFVYGLKYSAN